MRTSRLSWLCAICALGCSAPSEIVVVVGVAEAPPGWLDTVRITVNGDRSFDAPMTANPRLPLSLGVSSSGTGELHAVAEALRDGAVVARQEGRMAFLPGRRLLLHLYLSPQCEGSTCDEGLTCHLDDCIDVLRGECPFEALLDNGSDIACASVGMDGGVADAGDRTDADVRDGGDGGDAEADAGPIDCLTALDCDDGNPCTTEDCDARRCVFGAVPAGTDCDDGIFCNGIDLCEGETCIHGSVSCPSSTPICDVVTDRCVECLDNEFCVNAKDDSAPCAPTSACGGTHDVIFQYGTCSAGTCTATFSHTGMVPEGCTLPDGVECGGRDDRCCGGVPASTSRRARTAAAAALWFAFLRRAAWPGGAPASAEPLARRGSFATSAPRPCDALA